MGTPTDRLYHGTVPSSGNGATGSPLPVSSSSAPPASPPPSTQYLGVEKRSQPMCGISLVNNILLRKTIRRAPDSRTKQSLYHEMPDPMHSPDTKSVSSGTGSDKSNDDPVLGDAFSNSNEPPTVVQFDPRGLVTAINRNQRTKQPSHGDRSTSSSSSYRYNSRGGLRQNPSSFMFRPMGTWSISLPAVAEEQSFEIEVESASIEKSDTGEDSGDFSAAESKEVLLAMRRLILQQQDALKEMSDENQRYRRELLKNENSILESIKERKHQQDVIDQLIRDKDRLEIESKSVRNELDAVKSQLELVRKAEDESLSWKFERLMEQDYEHDLVQSAKDEAEPELDSIGRCKDSKRPDEHRKSSSREKGRTRTPPHPRHGSAPKNNRDERDDLVLRERRHSMERDDDRERSSENGSLSTNSRSYTWEGSKRRTGSSSKEDVDLFKQRLESIQKKRLQRRQERYRKSPTVVRFSSSP